MCLLDDVGSIRSDIILLQQESRQVYIRAMATRLHLHESLGVPHDHRQPPRQVRHLLWLIILEITAFLLDIFEAVWA